MAPEMSQKGEIDLAREGDFLLGRLEVRPSMREIRVGGRAETVEPRVMQVLVALVRADGAVVSRDQLTERCWGGRIVGEDAINRCIAKVRKVAELDGNASFAIETVARVGYRLSHLKAATIESLTPPPDAPDPVQTQIVSAAPTVLPFAILPVSKQRPSWRWIAGSMAMGVLAAAAFVLWQQRSVKEWSIDKFQMLVSSPVFENHPALAPNGAMLAYAAGTKAGGHSIYLRNLTDGDAVRLTEGNDDSSPAWSPQSDRIAFVRAIPGKPCAIFIKPVPAGPEREAAHCQSTEDTKLAWGAGGGLYFIDAPDVGSPGRIVKLDLATGKRTNVTHPNPLTATDREPVISPDEKSIAFYRDQYPHSGIFVLDLATGKERRLTPDGLSVWGSGWTSDSQSIVVGTLAPDEPALWIYHLDGSAPKRLTFNQQEFGRITGGPGNIAAVEVYTSRMSLIATKPGAASETLIEQNGDILDPDITVGGSIVFVAYGSNSVSLMVKPANEDAHKIATFKQIINPRWSPDGTRIAFANSDAKYSRIGIVRADGSARITAVTMSADAQASAPVWSADAKTLLFSANDGHGWRLWRVAADGSGKPEALPGYGWYSVRVHGDDLYASRVDKPGVWKLGATPQLITPNPQPDYWADWQVAGNAIVYADFSNSRHPKIVTHPLDGRADTVTEAPGMWQTLAGAVFTLDPQTGAPVYIRDDSDSDIALVHLGKK